MDSSIRAGSLRGQITFECVGLLRAHCDARIPSICNAWRGPIAHPQRLRTVTWQRSGDIETLIAEPALEMLFLSLAFRVAKIAQNCTIPHNQTAFAVKGISGRSGCGSINCTSAAF